MTTRCHCSQLGGFNIFLDSLTSCETACERDIYAISQEFVGKVILLTGQPAVLLRENGEREPHGKGDF